MPYKTTNKTEMTLVFGGGHTTVLMGICCVDIDCDTWQVRWILKNGVNEEYVKRLINHINTAYDNSDFDSVDSLREKIRALFQYVGP